MMYMSVLTIRFGIILSCIQILRKMSSLGILLASVCFYIKRRYFKLKKAIFQKSLKTIISEKKTNKFSEKIMVK